MATPQTFVVTTIGRVAIPKLADTLVKTGANKFVKQYGQKAFEAVLGTSIGARAYSKTEEYMTEYLNHIDTGGDEESFVPKGSMPTATRADQMDAVMAVPNTTPFAGDLKVPGVIAPDATEIEKESQKIRDMTMPVGFPADPPIKVDTTTGDSEPPEIETTEEFPIEDKLPDTLSTPIPEPEGPQIFYSKKDDVTKQTKDLVPEKPEFGGLTETEKQTAQALKGDSPDFYSRVVESIKDAKPNKLTKNKWKSFIQGDKDEIKYLGLDKLLQGNESITKQELLDFVDKKNITPNITVRSIPTDEMNTMYGSYSLGSEKEGTQENIVFQFGRKNVLVDAVTSRPYDAEVKPLFKSEHFDTEYGTNTFAHARTQVGYGDPDKIEDEMNMAIRVAESNKDKLQYAGFSDSDYRESLEIAKEFDNTLIVDEIQSDWLQKGRTKGFVSDYDIIKGDKLVDYFKKNNISYKISDPPLTVEFQKTDGKEIKPGDAPEIGVMDPNITYFFRKSDKTEAFKWDPEAYEEDARYSTPEEFLQRAYGKVPDFPIKESKKWVELVLNKMIEKAVLDGRDSIAITNGQVHANRYEAMGKEEKKGLKKFYDDIVFKQLEKISDKYNVELERTDISEGEAPEELQNIYMGNKIKVAQDEGFILKKVNLQFLWDRTKDTDIPGHAALFSDAGVGQGANYIEDYINELVDYRPFSPATGTGSGLDKWNEIKNDEVYIWIKERDISKDIIGWELPIVPVKDAVNYAKSSLLPELLGNDLGSYKKYIQDIRPPKGEEINPEQLIKMKLPKKLQKEILSKPIKLSKAKQQTDRLFA